MSVGLFKDTDGSTSSRIVSLFVVIVFDLTIIALSTILQKDIPINASNILITITTSCIPVALASQTYQNIKERNIKEENTKEEENNKGQI